VRAVAAVVMAMLVVGGVIAALALAGPAVPSGSVHRLVPAATTLDTAPATAPAPAPVTAPASSQAPAPATAASEDTTTTTTATTQPQPAIGGPAHGVCTSPSGFCSY
jgi:hypothetical protein